jgi:hypothetical protein
VGNFTDLDYIVDVLLGIKNLSTRMVPLNKSNMFAEKKVVEELFNKKENEI